MKLEANDGVFSARAGNDVGRPRPFRPATVGNPAFFAKMSYLPLFSALPESIFY
jgi:hypothetical protein